MSVLRPAYEHSQPLGMVAGLLDRPVSYKPMKEIR